MKKTLVAVTFLILLATIQSLKAQIQAEISQPPDGKNQRAEVSQWIGLVKITIAYHSPNVHGLGKDRTDHIWGELVNYGFFDEGFGPSKATPWRAGANENTTISFSHDLKVEGKDIKAGTYGLFLKLEKQGPWTWIFSHQSTGWGSFQYEPKNDALRVEVNPLDAVYTEFLTYGFDERRPNSATAYLQWEKKRIPFKIEVPNINELYVEQIRKDLLSWPGFNYQNWQVAAQFCADNKINLDEALVWADKAINEPFRNAVRGVADFSTLSTKAAVLSALGRDAEAEATMNKAVRITGTTPLQIHQYGLRLLGAKQNDKALEIFKLNQQLHPDEKFVTYLGLARGYTALGDKTNAIKNWEIVLQNVPESRKASIPAFQDQLKKLKEGQ